MNEDEDESLVLVLVLVSLGVSEFQLLLLLTGIWYLGVLFANYAYISYRTEFLRIADGSKPSLHATGI